MSGRQIRCYDPERIGHEVWKLVQSGEEGEQYLINKIREAYNMGIAFERDQRRQRESQSESNRQKSFGWSREPFSESRT